METPQTNPTTTTKKSGAGGRMLKGCGCLVGALAMVLGILITGDFDATSWASALTALVIGVLVFSFSGINGFWERDE